MISLIIFAAAKAGTEVSKSHVHRAAERASTAAKGTLLQQNDHCHHTHRPALHTRILNLNSLQRPIWSL